MLTKEEEDIASGKPIAKARPRQKPTVTMNPVSIPPTEFEQHNYDVTSILGCVIERNSSRGAKHGPSERQRVYYTAKQMLKKARQKKHGNHPTILSRWYASESYRDSLSAIGWKEKDLMLYDRIALEKHVYVATKAENSKLEALDSRVRCRRTSATTQSTTRLCSSEKRMQTIARRAPGTSREPTGRMNSTPTNTARTELHSMITFQHANTSGQELEGSRLLHHIKSFLCDNTEMWYSGLPAVQPLQIDWPRKCVIPSYWRERNRAIFFVAMLRGLVEEFSEPGQSRNVQEGLLSCGEADGFEFHERVASTVHAMMISKANLWRLVWSAVKAETELIQ